MQEGSLTTQGGDEDTQQGHPFLLWNLRLLEAFFSQASGGDEAWLQVSPAELDSLAPDLGGDEGFCRAVRLGPPWLRAAKDLGAAFVQRTNALVDQRSARTLRPTAYRDPGQASAAYSGKSAPVYLPYLAALVRSAAVARDGFYQHLSQAMGFSGHWGSQEMANLQPAWKDLERWTTECHGYFGYFKLRVLGGYKQIGVPRSQSIVSPRDSSLFGRVFAQVGLRPGQQLGKPELDDIKARASDAFFLSAGFREALARGEYGEPIDARLEALFQDWDGTVPSLGQANEAGARTPTEAGSNRDIELGLTLSDDNDFPWRIHFRVPPIRDSGELILQRGGDRWRARLSGTEAATTEDDAELQSATAECLSQSGHADIAFDARYCHEDGEQTPAGSLIFPKKLLRVLVWSYDALHQRDELCERSLPLNGPAYLLAPPHNAQRLAAYLSRESLDHEVISTEGLPPGWLMACVLDCAKLTEEQRATLPDGASERPAARALRFVGGRSVSRAGVRQYLSYDLPAIELDAPPQSRIQADGVLLEEEASGGSRSGIRRFRIRRLPAGALSFTFKAIHGRQPLGEARLRIAADSGMAVEAEGEFALDPMGVPARDGRGLRGVLVGPSPDGPAPETFTAVRSELGLLGNSALAARTAASPGALFLDSLAQAGSIAFGTARDQLARLLLEAGRNQSPEHSLLRLRSAGHLELESDYKGHFTRVHAVAPTLYSTSLALGGQPVHGLLGTLRLRHWEWLAGLQGNASVFCDADGQQVLDCWRIAVERDAGITLARDAGLAWREAPSLAIARWAPQHSDVRSAIQQWAVHSLGEPGEDVRAFNPGKALFFHSAQGLVVNGDVECQLFKIEDRETRRHDVYALALLREAKPPCFAFVRDSRWGVWLAMASFGEFFKQRFGLDDASPWPIPYSAASGTMWLPARAGLPAVLERALCLCSGDAPDVIEIAGEPGSAGILLRHGRADLPTPSVSFVYSQMATGKWLAYPGVPRQVAEEVATKLGGLVADA